jgi:hypothetical protein
MMIDVLDGWSAPDPKIDFQLIKSIYECSSFAIKNV